MKLIDIILLAPLAWGAFKGLSRGFLMQIVSVIAIILGLIIGFKLMDAGIDLLNGLIDINKSYLPFISFVLIFILVLVGVHALGKTMKSILNITLLGTADHIAGAVFGFLKWGLCLSIVIWLSHDAGLSLSDKHTEGSLVYPLMLDFGPKILDVSSSIIPFSSDIISSVSQKCSIN